MDTITIRPFESRDWPAIWPMLEAVFRAGETYPQALDTTEQEGYQFWIETPAATYVAVDPDGTPVGTYYIKPFHVGRGSHVCNCGYIVAESARGRGVATQMCRHSQEEAVRLGYRAMQFSLVVSTNETAFRLWKKNGFAVIGALPGAYHHAVHGYVDAYVMYKVLVD